MELLIPFANTGEKEDFSTTTDPTGKVSLEKGFTELYELKPEEGGLFILRKVFNKMMNLVTTDTVNWKTQTFPNWIADKGDGLPYAYPKNAIIKYTNGNTYVSLVDNNTKIPTGANWKLFDIASLDNTVKLSGNQTIAGVKTFTSNIVAPSTSLETTNNIVATADYVRNKARLLQTRKLVARNQGVDYTNAGLLPITITISASGNYDTTTRIVYSINGSVIGGNSSRVNVSPTFNYSSVSFDVLPGETWSYTAIGASIQVVEIS